jgi:hypothetical protein
MKAKCASPAPLDGAQGKTPAIAKHAAACEKDERATIMVHIAEDEGKRQIEGSGAVPSGGAK